MNFYQLLLVGSGGFFGSVARYLTSRTIDAKLNSVFPYGTFAVNVIGSFILGIVYIVAMRKTGGSDNIRLLLGTGFCGGFTTFSAFAFENLNLLDQKLIGSSLIYITASLVFGVIAVFAGIAVGKSLL